MEVVTIYGHSPEYSVTFFILFDKISVSTFKKHSYDITPLYFQ